MSEQIELETLWGQRLAGVELKKIDLFRPITEQDVKYLINRYPFLHIANSAPLTKKSIEPKIIESKSGWLIHDYGEALLSSPGEQLYGGYDHEKFLKLLLKDDDDGGEDGGELLPWKGTIIKQMVDTASEMVKTAIQKGWPAIDIIDGTQLMQWAAWDQAQQDKINLFGFTANEEDESRARRMQKLLTSISKAPQPRM